MGEIGADTKQSEVIAELPYVTMLIAAFIGIAISSFIGRPATLYWQLLVPAYALMCIVAGWERDATSAQHMRVVVRQAIHWLACFIAMRLLFLPEVRGVLNDNAAGLSILTVLALATFLAGLHGGAWRIAVVESCWPSACRPPGGWSNRRSCLRPKRSWSPDLSLCSSGRDRDGAMRRDEERRSSMSITRFWRRTGIASVVALGLAGCAGPEGFLAPVPSSFQSH